MSVQKEQIVRVYLIYIGMAVFAIAVLVRILTLQWVHGGELMEEVESATFKMQEIEAPRGNIYADNVQKTTLALSVPRYEIRMDLKTVATEVFDLNVKSLADSLAFLFENKTAQQWESDLRQAKAKNNQYYLIQSKVRNDQLNKLKSFPIFNLGKFQGGLIVLESTLRTNPYGKLAQRTIGYVKSEGDLKVGLEGAYDHHLQGQNGNMLTEKIGGGVWKPIDSDLSKEPIPGSDIYTSLDINLQDVAHTALYKQLVDQSAARGCAIVMEVETGYIKAIVNLEKDAKDGNYYESQNLAIGMSTEPGSTFKLASLMVALDHQKIRITDSVNMSGQYTYYGKTLNDHHAYGKGTVKDAFEKSSNVISKLIYDNYKLNPQEYIDGLKAIGLHKTLDIPIIGEGKPLIKEASDPSFSKISLPWMSIGYEVQLTPLQILTFYNSVANNGVMLKPQFVKEIRKGNKVIETFEPIVINPQVCKPSTLADLKLMLEGVVLNGTAKNIIARGFSIAGKTGTARIAQAGGYTDKHQASFCGYFPADNPKYSCIVVVQGPSNSIYGAVVSGTVFKEIADKIYATGLQGKRIENEELLASSTFPPAKNGSRFELTRVYDEMKVPYKMNFGEQSSNFVIASTSGTKVELKDNVFNNKMVPNVVGMGLIDAIYMLEIYGLSVVVKGSGVVKSQSISSGSKIIKGQVITLVLS
jgi:cell division protein FtsI (penicillin-binding protein 3)